MYVYPSNLFQDTHQLRSTSFGILNPLCNSHQATISRSRLWPILQYVFHEHGEHLEVVPLVQAFASVYNVVFERWPQSPEEAGFFVCFPLGCFWLESIFIFGVKKRKRRVMRINVGEYTIKRRVYCDIKDYSNTILVQY